MSTKAKPAKAPKLKIWNGRGFRMIDGKARKIEHVYVAATSRADAVRLINEVAGWASVNDNELKTYYSPCWGNQMDGITPERGVWVTWTRTSTEKPTRLLPMTNTVRYE